MGVFDNCRFIIDEHGDVVRCPNLWDWANWFENRDNRVARTKLDNGLVVSTIFLGIDYNFAGLVGGEPLLFESMIFFGDGSIGGPWRYHDWPRAAAHHLELVEEYKKRAAGD